MHQISTKTDILEELRQCITYNDLLTKLLKRKLDDVLDPALTVQLVTSLLSPAIGARLKHCGLQLQSKPPYKLNEQLEVLSFLNILSMEELRTLKVYLMTILRVYYERQQQGTAVQPKDRVFTFVGDQEKFNGQLGWGFNGVWIFAEQWDLPIRKLVDQLKRRCPAFANEKINAAFITGTQSIKFIKLNISVGHLPARKKVMESAEQKDADLDYLAYRSHQDKNESLWLENHGEHSVWGLTVIVDIEHPLEPVHLEGWRFRVAQHPENKPLFDVPMPDNSFLCQPRGMQLNWNHSVYGKHSRYLRWIITFRNILEEKIGSESLRFKDKISDTSEPCTLGKYTVNGYKYSGPYSIFHGPSNPVKESKDSSLKQLEWKEKQYEWAQLLHRGYRICKNPVCNATFPPKSTGNCQCSIPYYYGNIDIEIGTEMTKAEMVQNRFIPSTSCSFAGNKDNGIAAVYIGAEHADNDVTNILDVDSPHIFVAGIYGRECIDGKWVQMFNQPAMRNVDFWTNIQFQIPVRLAVATYWNKDCATFTYLGLWKVLSLIYEENEDRENDTKSKCVARIKFRPWNLELYR